VLQARLPFDHGSVGIWGGAGPTLVVDATLGPWRFPHTPSHPHHTPCTQSNSIGSAHHFCSTGRGYYCSREVVGGSRKDGLVGTAHPTILPRSFYNRLYCKYKGPDELVLSVEQIRLLFRVCFTPVIHEGVHCHRACGNGEVISHPTSISLRPEGISCPWTIVT
jgi:hypothetical protein